MNGMIDVLFSEFSHSRLFLFLNKTRSGFTMIELIIVMIIIGILAATVIIKWPGKSFNLPAQADIIVQDIRYTQSLAMSRAQSGERYRIYFYTTSYRITDNNGTRISHPTAGQADSVLGSGISFQSNGFNGYLAFDNLGQPYSGTTLLSVNTSVQLAGGGLTRTLTVSKNTGAVRISSP
jgi:prepilin-type N-terminal cleavage/methylation domain-containing protein